MKAVFLCLVFGWTFIVSCQVGAFIAKVQKTETETSDWIQNQSRPADSSKKCGCIATSAGRSLKASCIDPLLNQTSTCIQKSCTVSVSSPTASYRFSSGVVCQPSACTSSRSNSTNKNGQGQVKGDATGLGPTMDKDTTCYLELNYDGENPNDKDKARLIFGSCEKDEVTGRCGCVFDPKVIWTDLPNVPDFITTCSTSK